MKELPPLIYVGDHCLPKQGSAPTTGLKACAQSNFEMVLALGKNKHVLNSKNIKELDVGNITVRNIETDEKDSIAEGFRPCDSSDFLKKAVDEKMNDLPPLMYVGKHCLPKETYALATGLKASSQSDLAVNDSGQITLFHCSQCKHKTTTAKKLKQHLEKTHNKKIHCCNKCQFDTNTIRSDAKCLKMEYREIEGYKKGSILLETTDHHIYRRNKSNSPYLCCYYSTITKAILKVSPDAEKCHGKLILF